MAGIKKTGGVRIKVSGFEGCLFVSGHFFCSFQITLFFLILK